MPELKNIFFKNLPIELISFFEDKGFFPRNYREASNFIKSFYALDNIKPFEVELNEPVETTSGSLDKVMITASDPFDCIIPEVWKSMSTSQRMSAVKMVFDYVCKQNVTKIKKPVLLFVPEFFSNKLNGYHNQRTNEMYISFVKISTIENPSKILSTMVHELFHAQQNYEKNKIMERHINYEDLNSYEKALFFEATDTFNALYNYSRKKEKNAFKKSASSLSSNELKLINYLEESKDKSWTSLKYLTYCTQEMENSAKSKEKSFLDKIYKSVENKYQLKGLKNEAINPTNYVIFLLGINGIHIKKEDFQEIAKIGKLCHMAHDNLKREMMFNGVKYLLDIYKNKAVTSKIDYADYDKFEKFYLQEKGIVSKSEEVEAL